MAEFFEVGDKVILNSGGPIMIITKIIDDGILVCSWVLTTGVYIRDQFDRRTVSLLVRED